MNETPTAVSLAPVEAEDLRAVVDRQPAPASAETIPFSIPLSQLGPSIVSRFDCCVGVDVPAVGRVHSWDCPDQGSPTRSGREYVVGEVPQTLRNFVDGVLPTVSQLSEEADALLGQLIFGAYQLARSRTSAGHCEECLMDVHLGIQAHTSSCRAGRVYGLLEKISKIDFHPNRKEAAPDGETGGASDGIHSRGLKPWRFCINCGKCDTAWVAQNLPLGVNSPFDLNALELNQVLESCTSQGYFHRTLFTHLCEGGAA